MAGALKSQPQEAPPKACFLHTITQQPSAPWRCKSYISLRCDFNELATLYPDFRDAWGDLRRRQSDERGESHDQPSDGVQQQQRLSGFVVGEKRDIDECCADRNSIIDFDANSFHCKSQAGDHGKRPQKRPKRTTTSKEDDSGRNDKNLCNEEKDNFESEAIKTSRILGETNGPGKPAASLKSKSKSTSFSSQINHSFNAALTRSLLDYHFNIRMPSLPEGRLCPPIPNRANYVVWLKELLAERSLRDFCRFSSLFDLGNGSDSSLNNIWTNQGIDIGTGVSAVYPLLLTTQLFASNGVFVGCHSKGLGEDSGRSSFDKGSKQWKFLATDTDPLAVQSAQANVAANHLEDQICVVQVDNLTDSSSKARSVSKVKGPLFSAMEASRKNQLFQPDLVANPKSCPSTGDAFVDNYPKFDFVMTNPPFYSSAKEATAPRAGDQRSRTDMSFNEGVYLPYVNVEGDMDCDDCANSVLDPNTKSGRDDGGDVGFVTAIMDDSQFFRHNITWYTSLIAKRSSLDAVLQKLQALDGVWGNRGQIRVVEFHQESTNEDVHHYSRGSREKARSSRVRWGVGWTYLRAVGRSSVCRVEGGLQSFDVWVNVNSIKTVNDGSIEAHSNKYAESQNPSITHELIQAESAYFKQLAACDEVVSRLTAYFESRREVNLKCSHRPRGMSEGGIFGCNNKIIENRQLEGDCVTVVEERFFNCNKSCAPLPQDTDSSNLPYEGHFVIDAFVISSGERNKNEEVRICVSLEMYAHTRRGTKLLDQIRGALPGEVSRTNRRWRRLMKKGHPIK